MNTESFEAFQAHWLAQGFDEVLERDWAPNTVLETHSHPFAARAVVTRGEMWLSVGGNTQHLRPVIAEALSQLVEDGLPATVRMNPGDLALMKGALEETLANPKPEFVADATVSAGGCLVESASMAVDATVEKRWARAVGNLGLDSTWNPDV